jgi:hypothetical protein
MTKYTPGPWKAQEFAGQINIWGKPKGAAVAYDCRTPADARLIAAAPELLAACRAIEESHLGGHYSAAFEAVRDAIAKATGEQP